MIRSSLPHGKAKLLADIGGTLGTKILLVPLSLVSSIVIARALQPEGRGVYAVVLTATELALLMTWLGANKAAIFYLARSPDDGKIRRTAFTLSLCNGILQSVGLAAVALLVHLSGQTDIPSAALLATAPLGIVLAIRSTWESFLRAEQRNHQVNALAVTYSICFAASLTTAAALGGLTEAHTALALRLPAMAVASGLALALLGRQARASIALGIDWLAAKALVSYGVPFTLLSLVQNMSYRFDVLLVQAFLDSRQVGYYSVATSVGELLWYLPAAVGFVLVPRSAAKREAEAAREAAALVRWTLGLTATGAAGLGMLATPLVQLFYGSAYLPAVDPLRLLLLGIVTTTWHQVLSGYLVGQGRLRGLLAVTLAGLALNVLLNLLLIPRMGLAGAALASTVSYSVTGLITVGIFRAITGCSLREVLVLQPAEMAKRMEFLRDWLARSRYGRR